MASVSLCSRDHRIGGGSFSPLQMKGLWESNIIVWFPVMYSQKWNCAPFISNTECSVSRVIHSYICERFIYFQDRSVNFAAAKYMDRSWKYINRSQIHECRNRDSGCTIPFLGIHKWDFRESAAARNSLADCCCMHVFVLVMSTILKRKCKRSDIEANYRNESKTFWFGSIIIGTKAKHFDLVQKDFYCKQIVSVLAQKFWDKAKQFDLVCKLS